MKGDRALVFGRIRAALAMRTERAPAPDFPNDVAVARAALAGNDLFEAFVRRLERVRGRVFTTPGALATWLRGERALRGYCDPDLLPLVGSAFDSGFVVETEFSRERIDDYAFGITRATLGIAETGTLVLDDASTSTRLAALAPWIHAAVLRRSEIVRDVGTALSMLGSDPSVIWVTGPSKTADVEGILIEGVHGPGEEVALVLD